MGAEIYEIFGKIAGIGGLALSVFLVLFREFIKAKFLPNDLTNEQGYKLLRLFLILCSIITLAGMGVWAYSSKVSATNSASVSKDSIKKDSIVKDIYDSSIDNKIINLQESVDQLMLNLTNSPKTYRSCQNDYDKINSQIKFIIIRATALNSPGSRYAILRA